MDDEAIVGSAAATTAYVLLPNGAVAYATGSNTFSVAGLDDQSDVTLTTPATGATLVKSAGDWVDGQLDLADTDAVTGLLPIGNVAAGLLPLAGGVMTGECS